MHKRCIPKSLQFESCLIISVIIAGSKLILGRVRSVFVRTFLYFLKIKYDPIGTFYYRDKRIRPQLSASWSFSAIGTGVLDSFSFI